MKKKTFISVLLLSLALALASVPAFAAGDSYTLTFKTEQTGDETNEKYPFKVHISPVTEGAPLPVNGETQDVSGSGEGSFTFDLTGRHAGEVYEYTLSLENPQEKNFSFDSSVYRVRLITINTEDGGISAEAVTVMEGKENDGKYEDPLFTASYQKPAPPPSSPIPVFPFSPGTGLDGNPTQLYLFLGIGAAAVILLLFAVVKRRKKS